MSCSFTIIYNNATKRVTCPSNFTINKLVSLSIEKFKLPLSTNASLSYKGKKLDGMLSIRLANVINNAKLDLTITELSDSVNLRINGICLNSQISKIFCVSPTISVATLVSEYLQQCGVNIDWRIYNVKISAMQNGIDNQTSDFDVISVASFVGTSSSASLRLVIETAADAKRTQEAQLEQQKLRERIELEKAEVRSKLAKDCQPLDDGSVAEVTVTNRIRQSDQGTSAEEAAEESELKKCRTDVETKANESVTQPLTSNTPHESETTPAKSIPSWQPPIELKDTLYNPRGHIDLYENPNEDYTVTAHHAETYLRSLQAMQKPSRKHVHIQPSKYTIRIRFPDRKFLDLVMEDASVPLGQLFKKLDSYVHPNFINSYVLKNGCPPFNEIEMGFHQNNVQLQNHPYFQEERVLLVWEPVSKLTHGPYLKEDIYSLDISEMPTVALESNRKNLQDEEPTDKPIAVPPRVSNATKEKRPGVPKWFRH